MASTAPSEIRVSSTAAPSNAPKNLFHDSNDRSCTVPKNPRRCGRSMPKDDSKLHVDEVPASERLCIRKKTPIDLIKDQIPKPEGCLPPTALPTWYEIDMSCKVPSMEGPPAYLYYSCGKLGTPLHRHHSFYTVWDQRNSERVVNARYNALHDPSTKSYFTRHLKLFLLRQGLINERCEVYCSHSDFNVFRSYLKTIFYNDVANVISTNDNFLKRERQQLQQIRKFMSGSSENGRQAVFEAKIQKGKALVEENKKRRVHTFEMKKKQAEMQLEHWKEELSKQSLVRVLIGIERDRKTVDRVCRVHFERLAARRDMLKATVVKEIELEERRKANQIIMEQAVELKRERFLDCKLRRSTNQLEHEMHIKRSMKAEFAKKSKKRQKRVEYIRKMLPAKIEKRKQEKERVMGLVRKFALRWLERVRKRLTAPKDYLHESVWTGNSKTVLDHTLKYLKEISGYEKMDDFVMNIIMLKREIQRQIELEEKEEAVAAAKANEGENEQEDGLADKSQDEYEDEHESNTEDFKKDQTKIEDKKAGADDKTILEAKKTDKVAGETESENPEVL